MYHGLYFFSQRKRLDHSQTRSCFLPAIGGDMSYARLHSMALFIFLYRREQIRSDAVKALFQLLNHPSAVPSYPSQLAWALFIFVYWKGGGSDQMQPCPYSTLISKLKHPLCSSWRSSSSGEDRSSCGISGRSSSCDISGSSSCCDISGGSSGDCNSSSDSIGDCSRSAVTATV